MNKVVRIFRYEWPVHFILLASNILPDNVLVMRLRGFLLRPFFKKCGKNLRIARGNIFYNSFNIEIGNDVFIAYGNWFSGSTLIQIDDEVMFGPKSIIISGNHGKENGSFRYGPNILKPIFIGRGTWIGGNSNILAGATIGKGCLIGAGTVVSKSVPDHVLFAGNPGAIVKAI
jgi:acetyltransferase-like isoleucine patch superfamily enzyme